MVNLVVDSGAFSAWNSGTAIDIEAYSNWLQDKLKYLWYYFSLDVIPAVRGRAPSPKEANAAARGSYENYCKMLDLGLQPVPVLHQFEDFEWLHKMLELKPPIIGVSPNKAIPMKDRLSWVESFFSYVCGDNPYPEMKYHGLGISSPRLVMPFPWYSFDTTNPILAAGRAELAIPRLNWDGTTNWNRSTLYVSVTERAKLNHRHVDFMGGDLESYIRDVVRKKGEDYEVLRKSRCLRFRFNADIFQNQFSNRPTPPFKRRRLNRLPKTFDGAVEPQNERVRIICAVNTSRCDNTALTQIGFEDRLVSYTFINNWDAKKVRQFVRTGVPRARGGVEIPCEAHLKPRRAPRIRPQLKTQ